MVYADKRILELGTLVRTHGVKGNLVLRLLPGWNDTILNNTRWIFLMIRSKPVPFMLTSCQPLNDKEVQVQLDGVATKEDAGELLQLPLAMEAKRMKRKAVHDNLSLFTGYSIISDGKNVGTIKAIEEHGPQLLFALDNGVLIPAHDDFIVSVDDEAEVIVMNLPEGLLEINSDSHEV